MKFLSLAVFFVLTITCGVLAQDKTLRIDNVTFRARPDSRGPAGYTGARLTNVVLDCVVEEDNVPFRLRYDAPMLDRLFGAVQTVSLSSWSRIIDSRREFCWPTEKTRFEGTPYVISTTRRNDRIPLPKAIVNPDPESSSDTNEIYEELRRNRYANLEYLSPNAYILDRAFVLDIAYRAGEYVSMNFLYAIEQPSTNVLSARFSTWRQAFGKSLAWSFLLIAHPSPCLLTGSLSFWLTESIVRTTSAK